MALRAASPTARMTSARSRTSLRVSRTDVNVPSVNTHSTAVQFLTLCFVFHHIKKYEQCHNTVWYNLYGPTHAESIDGQ